MTKKIVVSVNGKSHEIDAGASVRETLRLFGLDPGSVRGVAVAVNESIVRRSDWSRRLAEGDAVEIVTAQQGG